MKDNNSGIVAEKGKRIRFGSVEIIDICPPCAPASTSNRYHALNESEESDEIHLMGLDRVEPVHDPRVDIHVVTKHHRTYDKSGKYVRLTCTSDSGAGESVLPKTWFPEIASEMSDKCNTDIVRVRRRDPPGKRWGEGPIWIYEGREEDQDELAIARCHEAIGFRGTSHRARTPSRLRRQRAWRRIHLT